MTMLALPDVQLNYQEAGEGSHVTMIHGLGANMAFWYLGPSRLMMQRNNLLMYDLRGHGVSTMPDHGYTLDRMADDLVALLDDRDIERTNLVGHSYGARVALAFAARHPDRISTLTVADTQIRALQKPMRLAEWPHWERWKEDLRAGGRVDFPSDDEPIDFRLLADLGQSLGRPAGAGAATPKRRINLNSRVMGNRGRQRWMKLLEETSAGTELHDESALTEKALQNIEVPTMLMYGNLSHCLPTSEALQDLLPDSRRVVVSGAGHFFPIVKPKMFARAYQQFLHIANERRRTGLSLRNRRRMHRVRNGFAQSAPMSMRRTS